MLRRLWTSIRRDHTIAFRNHYFTVTVAFALLYLVVVLLLPDRATIRQTTYLLDETKDGRIGLAAQQMGLESPFHLVRSRAELREALEQNRNAMGVAVAEGSPLPRTTLFFQGHENPRLRATMAVTVEEWLREVEQIGHEQPVQIATMALSGQSKAAKVPLSRALVPFFLFSDAGMLGLLLIAALIFFEKEEGTLRAYLVTPGRIWEFLLSKVLTLGVVAVAFTAVLVPPTLGLSPNWVHLVAIMFLGSVLTSLLGALLAVFFENLTQFIFPALGVMAAISLPQISFFMPSFSPLWVRWIPTYPMVFGLREAAFPSGHPSIVYSAMAILLAVNLVLLLMVSVAYRRKLAER